MTNGHATARRGLVLALALALAGGCSDDVDPEWQLEHDRIVAVRATPPRIVTGEQAVLDLLIARVGAAPTELAPAAATVVSPESLASSLALDQGAWVVTAPSEAQLDAARTELGLEAGAPVPLTIGVGITEANFPSGAGPFAATKVVWLGESAANPVIGSALVDGVEAVGAAELVIGQLVDVRLSVDFVEPDRVRWLTSCGTMHDFDLPQAYLRVEADDPTAGSLATVVRAANGGVAWQIWPIRAE